MSGKDQLPSLKLEIALGEDLAGCAVEEVWMKRAEFSFGTHVILRIKTPRGVTHYAETVDDVELLRAKTAVRDAFIARCEDHVRRFIAP